MDAETFDRLIAGVARRPTRRSTLRLLAGGMLGAWLSQRGAAPARAAPPAQACTGVGGPCAAHSACCGYDTPNILCCFDANGAGICTDVSVRSFLCPDPGVPATGCAAGLTDCGGFCTDLAVDHGNCGFCGNRCSQVGPDYNCVSGTCTKYCSPGLVDCGGTCIDLASDVFHCGACYTPCSLEAHCAGGVCVMEVEDEPEAPGGGGDDIDDVEDKADPCHVDPDGGYPDDLCMEEGEESEDDQE